MIMEAINRPNSPFWKFSATLVGLFLETAGLLSETQEPPFFVVDNENMEDLRALEAELGR